MRIRTHRRFVARCSLIAIAAAAPLGIGAPVLAQSLPAAQTPPVVPPSLDPSRIRENLTRPAPPKTAPRITLPGPKEQLPPEKAEAAKFTFRALKIEGAHAIPEEELRKAWPHQVGATSSAADIFRFAEAITAAYRRAGYALSFAIVPAQDIDDGSFTVRVIEGFVERVDVTGDAGPQVRAHVAAITRRLEGNGPLRTVDLERALLLANDVPGVTASAVLSPAATEGGSVLTISVAHDPATVGFTYNNLLPASLGRHSGEISAELRGLVTGADLLRISGQHSLNGSTYGSASGEYATGIGASGLRLGVSGLYSRMKPDDATLAAVDYKGNTVTARLTADYPLIRSRDRTVRLGMAVALNNVGSDILAQRLFDDRLRTVDLWTSYDLVDAGNGVTSVTATVSKGLSVMGARGNSRANGRADFTTLSVDIQHNRPLGTASGGRVSVAIDTHAQAAVGGGGLLSPTECSYGGSRFGRAFDAGVFTGDHCAMGSATVHWARPVGPGMVDLYLFADGGTARQKGALEAGQKRVVWGAAAGGGAAMQVSRIINGFVELGRQVSLSDGSTRNGLRVRGGLTVRF